ncbi:hypothetical protein CR513_44737, partial [Mucuna pruriens]
MNKVRGVLKRKSLPNQIWREVVNTIVYILNRSPTKRWKWTIPKEVWTRRRLSVGHLRETGRSWMIESEPIILLGYHPTDAYKLYNLLTKKVMYSRYNSAAKYELEVHNPIQFREDSDPILSEQVEDVVENCEQ